MFRPQINTVLIYSGFNIFIIVLLTIGVHFVKNAYAYAIFTVMVLAVVNIVLLIMQLREKNELYEDARLKSQKLDYVKGEIIRYRRHRHDVKNHLIVIAELTHLKKFDELSRYTQRLINDTNNALVECQTGLDEIDVLIYSKKNAAEHLNIDFNLNLSTAIKINKRYILSLVSIISNILDNAIEATSRIEIASERFVKIRIYDDVLSYYFVVTNSFSPKYYIDPKYALISRFTTKQDHINHGLGLNIVKKTVKKFGGILKIDIYNGVFFQVKVELPKHSL